MDAKAYVSDVSFDHVGELLASCSTDGRIAIHQAQQFTCTVPTAEMDASIAAAEAAAESEQAVASMDPQRMLAAAAARKAQHAESCEPLLSISTRLCARSIRWNPMHTDQIVCAFANSHQLHIFDLGAADPQRPAHVLRSSSSYSAQQGVADLAFLPHMGTVVAGGRDGQLRVWDLRSPQPLIAQSVAATGGWTMGVRSQDCRTGAINALVAAPDSLRLHAATEEGCVVSWDNRALNTPLGVMRVGRALSLWRGSADGLVALSHHPTLRDTLCAQTSSGSALTVDVSTSVVLAARQPPPRAAPPCAQPSTAAATPVLVPAPVPAGALPAGTAETVPLSTEWHVRRRRGAWLGGGAAGCGSAWWCAGLVGSPGLATIRLSAHCTELGTTAAVPTSAPVVAVDAHPSEHYLAVGFLDNSIGVVAPLPAAEPQLSGSADEAAADNADDVGPGPPEAIQLLGAD